MVWFVLKKKFFLKIIMVIIIIAIKRPIKRQPHPNQSKNAMAHSLQSLAREAEHFIDPETLAEMSYEVCVNAIKDKAFVSSVAKYISRIFVHCQERHGHVDRHYNFLAFLACPLICAFPVEYNDKYNEKYKDGSKGVDATEIFQEVVDSGRRYSAKLKAITGFFAAPTPVDFADIPPAATEGLIELVEDYNDKYAIWKNLTDSKDGGKIFDLVRRLEKTTVMHGHPAITARAYSAVDKLRTRALVVLGSEELALLDAKVVSDLRRIADDQHSAQLATKDPGMRLMFALVVDRAETRIQHYSDAEGLGTFFDLYAGDG